MASNRSQRTIDAIMAAAHTEFSELGPGGARVDSIAAGAGVNKQRIYAYFESKEGLFGAVLSRAFAQLTTAVPIPRTLEGLRRYAGEVFDYHREDPSLIRLLAWEGLHYREKAVPTDYSRVAYYENSVRELAAVIGLEPARVSRTLLEIVGIASWPHVVPQQRRLMVVGSRRENADDLDRLRDVVALTGRIVADQLVTAGEVPNQLTG